MEKFDFKYVSTPEEARAQVQAYLNEVGKRIKAINEHEERVMDEARKLEFLKEQLPDMVERIETARLTYETSFVSTGCVEHNDLTKEALCDALAEAHKYLFGACNLLVEAVEAVKLLKFAVENTDLEYKLKANMLDEAMRFQTKYWQLTETEH